MRRGVLALIPSGVAVEETVPHIRCIGRVCRIFSRRLYRALDAEDICHRRIASPTVLIAVCSRSTIDYMLEHPDLPWLPTQPEKVDALEALGIERRLLPSRLDAVSPGAPGGAFRSSRPSRSMAPARCSSTPIQAMTP